MRFNPCYHYYRQDVGNAAGTVEGESLPSSWKEVLIRKAVSITYR